uniref:F-box domain-containing protein n=1 Tax=Fagus sylvatica TaxID=28930 RepID=A0A2N9EFR3_FAGSY
MSESQPRKKSIFLSEHVPYDVVYDILTWVPVKSIMRFRCVSKSCNSIITDPIFNTIHLDKANSLSKNNNNNGYLLYMLQKQYIPEKQDFNELSTVVYNKDQTLTEISRFEIPITDISILGFCNGMFFLCHDSKEILYLWNPSIRKYKMLPPHFIGHYRGVAHGLAYHSQNNDYKILRLGFRIAVKGISAQVYTLSTDSWRKVVVLLDSEPNNILIDIDTEHCLFLNGALHFIVHSREYSFILTFDVDDERFRKIMLPQNFFGGVVCLNIQSLAVMKGSLALILFSKDIDAITHSICNIWVMREYGVVESWTKRCVRVDWVRCFYGCTDNGELLIEKADELVSFDPESLNENILAIEAIDYTANSMESLVLLDGASISYDSMESLVLLDAASVSSE